jgi:superfamily II DNA or RNA helicase
MPLNTYIGQKGYTLLKDELTPQQIHFIKTELMIKPYTPGAPGGGCADVSFPVYRESVSKIYVPRYFGQKQYGAPLQINISDGTNINVEFTGTLRDYQAPVVKKYLDTVLSKEGADGGLLELYCAWGKTSASLYIISALKKKTIVIVHKEFLMNQWIERIQQFLPSARVGKIQGQIIDIEDKDIVLCMLQSLTLKEYPAQVFESFGLTIIDEVHHISSQTFSSALFKVVTKYMLGLSATMNRKDGTTHVFKMFLGEVIYKAEQKANSNVEVRAIQYKTTDEEFNSTIMDYRGQPQISSMISKLCSYNRRTEFIIQTLNDFICIEGIDKKVIDDHKLQMDLANPCCQTCNKSNNYLMKNTCCQLVKYCMICLDAIVVAAQVPEIVLNKKTGEEKEVKRRPKCPDCAKVLSYEQNYIENPFVKPLSDTHTIIMSHNLNVLEYMYKKLVCKNYASVGYYVGGMDEASLKNSETKQVILSSYGMAAEGLDISTLNAEFLISPKTDIEQCVGRILRAKHATNTPIIYDFIDSHDVFKKQWLKRKAFYKKQNYKIVEFGKGAKPDKLDETTGKEYVMPGECLLIKKK